MAFLKMGCIISLMLEETEKEKQKPSPKLTIEFNEKTKKIIIVFLAFLALAFLIFNFKHLFIAAMVNNQPITRYALDRELEKQGGQQVLENLITQALILQEAKKQGIEISEEEIKGKMAETEEQVEAQGSDLDTLLESQGLTREYLEEQIRIQLIIEETVGKDISITDEEIEDYFEGNKDYFGEDVLFEEVKDQLEEELRQTKLTEEYQLWLEELKQQASIHYFLKF